MYVGRGRVGGMHARRQSSNTHAHETWMNVIFHLSQTSNGAKSTTRRYSERNSHAIKTSDQTQDLYVYSTYTHARCMRSYQDLADDSANHVFITHARGISKSLHAPAVPVARFHVCLLLYLRAPQNLAVMSQASKLMMTSLRSERCTTVHGRVMRRPFRMGW